MFSDRCYSLPSICLIFYLFKLQREYEEFKVRINALVAKAQKVPEEGWTMQDGTLWPGNNVRDHPGMIQVHELYFYFCTILVATNSGIKTCFAIRHRFFLVKVEGMTQTEMNCHAWCMSLGKRDLVLITTKRLEQ